MNCDTIPYELAVKLKESGYPQDHDVRYVWLNGRAVDVLWMDEFDRCRYDDADRDGTLVAIPTYAQVFDWLMEKGISCEITRFIDFAYENVCTEWDWNIEEVGPIKDAPGGYANTWREAANAAIEKALTLI